VCLRSGDVTEPHRIEFAWSDDGILQVAKHSI
jgi:hypothetical protein